MTKTMQSKTESRFETTSTKTSFSSISNVDVENDDEMNLLSCSRSELETLMKRHEQELSSSKLQVLRSSSNHKSTSNTTTKSSAASAATAFTPPNSRPKTSPKTPKKTHESKHLHSKQLSPKNISLTSTMHEIVIDEPILRNHPTDRHNPTVFRAYSGEDVVVLVPPHAIIEQHGGFSSTTTTPTTTVARPSMTNHNEKSGHCDFQPPQPIQSIMEIRNPTTKRNQPSSNENANSSSLRSLTSFHSTYSNSSKPNSSPNSRRSAPLRRNKKFRRMGSSSRMIQMMNPESPQQMNHHPSDTTTTHVFATSSSSWRHSGGGNHHGAAHSRRSILSNASSFKTTSTGYELDFLMHHMDDLSIQHEHPEHMVFHHPHYSPSKNEFEKNERIRPGNPLAQTMEQHEPPMKPLDPDHSQDNYYYDDFPDDYSHDDYNDYRMDLLMLHELVDKKEEQKKDYEGDLHYDDDDDDSPAQYTRPFHPYHPHKSSSMSTLGSEKTIPLIQFIDTAQVGTANRPMNHP